MKYLMFYNSNDEKKLALELDNEIELINMSGNTIKFINKLCSKNKYHFSYYFVEVNFDLKSIPIIPISILENKK